jgi:hypothetical protein
MYISNGISLDNYTKSLRPANFSAAYINQGPFSFPNGKKERSEKAGKVVRNSNQVLSAGIGF